ncbi:MAG: glycosyltransferase family 39 protein [Solirubrobacteraceae bacterium]
MSAATAAGRSLASGRPGIATTRMSAWLPPALVAALAAALRLPGLAGVRVNPFYDAAVRTMGTSWHALLTGAMDPSGQVAVDKPPVDLWLQVASTKLLGFTPLALHLPEALGGIVAVLALYDLLRVLFGRGPAVAGALALAVLPMAVITARSDTMDSVMAALVIGAAALTARAARGGRPRLLLAAGAVLGLAFEVKLFEALVAAPALIALWWFAAPGSRRARASALGRAGAAFAAVALAWLLALSLVPGPHPWAFGSAHGSAWDATFVYDGLSRLQGTATAHAHATAAALARAPAPPGPLRLFGARAHVGIRVGPALAAALLVRLAAALASVPRGLDRVGRAGWWALAGWLTTGVVLFSAQQGLKPRYLEAVDPAIAAVLGVGVVLLARRARTAWVVAALALLLAAPAVVAASAAANGAEDAGAPGGLAPARAAALSAYLRAHRGTARYEAASVSVGRGASLIARDGQPVLLLTTANARPLVGVGALAHAVAAGAVRYAVGDASSAPVARWIRTHGTDVSAAAGQAPGTLYALSA